MKNSKRALRKKLEYMDSARNLPKKKMLAGVLVFALLGSILLVSSHAATLTASYQAEAGTRSGTASLVPDTGASGGSAVKFSTPGGTVPNPLKIMALGDSLTQGGVNGNLPGGGPDPSSINGYRLSLWNLLSDYTVDYVGPWQSGNSQLPDKDLAGFSGACIKASPCGGGTLYPQTAGWLNTYNPDLVIMQGGANDYSVSGQNDITIQASLESWIQLVWATKPNAKIIVSGQAQWHPELEALNKAYVEGLQAQGKAIRFVPFAETVGTDANTVDLTHPNATGYQIWANELAPKVRELFPQ